ncbi:uncharacterized protein LTR77_002506 [Saxophila tyrrhenica]|uniref:Uncharacterized protein n=1 Tax=Saxophila tyrrhenica TaxID=1690608 RepID=A0AAV9PJD0_9PEZI|nr:hypothetical protein LTR77_002506 [Saxophila tyrrhenica]
MYSSMNSKTMEQDVKAIVDEQSLYSARVSLPPYSSRPYDTASTTLASPTPELIQQPCYLLTVQAHGSSGCSSSLDHSIPIFAGTDVTAQPLYISRRIHKWRNNSVLSHAHEGDIISTTYRFGPYREPKIRYLQSSEAFGSDVKSAAAGTDTGGDDEGSPLALKIHTSLVCLSTSTSLSSATDPTRTYKWKYTRTKTIIDGKLRVMVLFAAGAAASTSSDGEAIAVLVRSSSTRTPGSSRWGQGNGGQLYISQSAGQYMEESLIVASCILMLKKEIDRGNAVVVGAATSSGGGGS